MPPRSSNTWVVLAAVLACAAHQWIWHGWTIEDAAISFAFARHLASGLGPVAFPGGPWVEGFSDPTWVALLTVASALGIDELVASRVLSVALTAGTVPLVWGLARRAAPHHPAAAAAAVVVLAADPVFAKWGASGLENSLWSFLLALGCLLLVDEVRTPRAPWSAVVWSALALTRPEGAAYAAIAGVWVILAGSRWRGWWLIVGALLGTTEAARVATFAWPLPNTFYAKLGGTTPSSAAATFAFGSRGWAYVWTWAVETGSLFAAPLVVLAAGTAQRATVWIPATLGAGLLLTAMGAAAPALQPLTYGWLWALAALVALWPLAARGRPGAIVTGLLWHTTMFGLFFAVAVRGDWMAGWRWVSLVSVPLAVLIGVGVSRVIATVAAHSAVPPRLKSALWPVLAVAWIVAGLRVTKALSDAPDTSPADVSLRVDMFDAAQARLHLDRASVLDVDMGAFLLRWPGPVLDIAGLVDPSIAHHKYGAAFVNQSLFEERRPDLAHVHGAWAKRLGVANLPAWEADYVPLPGYQQSPTIFHLGSFVRREHLLAPANAPTTPETVRFGDVATVVAWRAPTHQAAAGGTLYVEVDLRDGPADDNDWRLIGFLSQRNRLTAFDVAPGYDWLPVDQWRDGETMRVRLAVPIPDNQRLGPNDLGFVLLTDDGVAPGTSDDRALTAEPPRFARGEVLWPNAVDVVTRATVDDEAIDTLVTAGELASVGDCEGAEDRWTLARAHKAGDTAWVRANRHVLGQAIAACWIGDAARTPLRAHAVELLTRARWWTPRGVGYTALATPLAEELVNDGNDAAALGDWELAYARFASAAALDPSHTWARRWAEDARDHALGLDARTRRADAARQSDAARLSETRP